MTKSPQSAPVVAPVQTAAISKNPVSRFLAAPEIDTRLLGMLAALLLIWGGFHTTAP